MDYLGPMGIFEDMFDDDPLIEALERGDDPEDGEYDEDEDDPGWDDDFEDDEDDFDEDD
jgi:hypothetical protein